jgi:hypothetical protein
MTTGPPGRSLRALGLAAIGSLDCPKGGFHHILEEDLEIAADEGGALVQCMKCGEQIELRSLAL